MWALLQYHIILLYIRRILCHPNAQHYKVLYLLILILAYNVPFRLGYGLYKKIVSLKIFYIDYYIIIVPSSFVVSVGTERLHLIKA